MIKVTVRKTSDMDIMAVHDIERFDSLPVIDKYPTADSDLASRIMS